MVTKWPEEMQKSIVSVFLTNVKKYGDRDMLLEKTGDVFQGKSWNQVAKEVRQLSLGLAALGVEPKDRVGLMMTTQRNWAISDLAILSAGAINVPIYPTNKGLQIAHIVKDAGIQVLILGSLELLEEVRAIWSEMPALNVLIVPDGSKGNVNLSTLEDSQKVMEMREVMELGKELDKKEPELYDRRWQAVNKEDLASVLYTSGTTGNPKGVMLTHDNFLSNVRGGLEKVPVYDHYVSLSFLPLSHVLERTAGYYMALMVGSTIAYAESIDALAANMQEVKPHFMVSVPRVYEKVYQRIIDGVDSGSGVKKKIFYWAKGLSKQNAYLIVENKKPAGCFGFKYKIAHKLVFSKVHTAFGGRLQFCISGGAPLGKDLAEFFNGIGLPVLEGYGLTETSPIITFNYFGSICYGSVGKVIPGGEVKIAEDGEILSKGPQNCPGYYNNPEATAELFDGEWLKTGDIGHLDKDGYLFITDRKKDLIVTSGGKNIAPQPLEGMLTNDKYVLQAVIQGDKRNYLVAMLVPNMEALDQYAKENNVTYKNQSDLLKMPEIREFYAQRVAMALKDSPRFEQVKRIWLRAEEFTTDNKELTPTLKVRRRFVFERYKDIFEQMYESKGDFIEVDYSREPSPQGAATMSKEV
jgi:long-chain acyl-CoA synthetase